MDEKDLGADLESVLVSEDEIKARIAALAAEIDAEAVRRRVEELRAADAEDERARRELARAEARVALVSG